MIPQNILWLAWLSEPHPADLLWVPRNFSGTPSITAELLVSWEPQDTSELNCNLLQPLRIPSWGSHDSKASLQVLLGSLGVPQNLLWFLWVPRIFYNYPGSSELLSWALLIPQGL